jgi:hypothetical protein
VTQRVPSANLATPLKLSLSLQALTRELRLLAEITQQLAQNLVDLEKRIDDLEEKERRRRS